MTCECRQTHTDTERHTGGIEKINAFEAAHVLNTNESYLAYELVTTVEIFMQVNKLRSQQIQLRVHCIYLFDQMRIINTNLQFSRGTYAHSVRRKIIYSPQTIYP